jgi:hypothetical protein
VQPEWRGATLLSIGGGSRVPALADATLAVLAIDCAPGSVHSGAEAQSSFPPMYWRLRPRRRRRRLAAAHRPRPPPQW